MSALAEELGNLLHLMSGLATFSSSPKICEIFSTSSGWKPKKTQADGILAMHSSAHSWLVPIRAQTTLGGALLRQQSHYPRLSFGFLVSMFP